MAFILQLFKPKYVALDSEDSSHEKDRLSGQGYCRGCSRKTNSTPTRSWNIRTIFWIFTTFLLLLVLGLIIVFELIIPDSLLRNSPGRGFSTELSTAKSEVSFRQVTFTGNINFFDNGTTYLEREIGSKIYAGKPTDEIDRNWRDLLHSPMIVPPSSFSTTNKLL